MVPSADRQRVKTLLTETITLLCKNGLHFKSGFSIEALIGITLDEDDVFLVSIKETVRPATCNSDGNSSPPDLSKQRHIRGISSSDHQTENWEQRHHEVYDDSSSNAPCDATLPSVQVRGRNVTECNRQSPEAPEQGGLRPNLKRRFSESGDREDRPTSDSYKEQQNSDPLFHTSSNFNELLVNRELLTRHYADSEDNAADSHRTERRSTGSAELLDVKQEPGTEGNGSRTFQGTESSSAVSSNLDLFFSNPTNFPFPGIAWNNFTQLSRQESSPVVKSISSVLMPTEDLNRSGSLTLDPLRPHRCCKCSKSFTTVQGRNLHEKLHDGIYQYNCPHCGKGCSGTTQLRGHMATHTQIKEFKCPICGQAYVYKKTLTDHIKRLHMEILSMPIM